MLELFYQYLAEDNEAAIKKMNIPKSDIFYIRAALKAKTGIEFSLDHIEKQVKEFEKYGR